MPKACNQFSVENQILKYLLMGSTAAILPLSAANAQTEQSVDAVESEDNIIIVTATKRASDIQDIPASISQIGGDDLEARGIDDIDNLALQVPNLTFGRFGNNTFVTMRGIGTTVDSGVAEPSIALYVDGVFLPRATMGTLRQVDLNRVEALRGPQGTLYGRNATGGAINFVSREPSSSFEGSISATVQNRDGFGLNGYVSGPLGDFVSVRVSGGYEKQDGYFNVINTGEKLGGTDVGYGRLAVKFDLSSTATLDMSVQHENNQAAVGWQSMTTAPVNVLGLFQAFGQPTPNFTLERNQGILDGPHEAFNKTTIASARLNWDLTDDISLRTTTGYVDHSTATSFDADATDGFFVDLVNSSRKSESFSQEINIYGETGPVSWLVGGFYFDERFELLLPVEFNGGALGAPFGARVPILAGNLVEDTKSYALFADVTVSLTDNLRILAGGRLNWEDKDFTFFGNPSPVGSLDSNDFLPKIGLQYDASEDVNFYAQWQKGIKSGGHQLSAPATFASEEVEAFEGGIKSQFLDGRLTINASAFFYDYTNLQATITIPPATTQVENGDAEIFGVEGEVFFTPVDNVNLNLGFSFLDSKYTRLVSSDQSLPGTPNVDLSGEELIRAPKFTINAGVDWTIPIESGALGSVTFRGDVFHSDSFKLAFFPYPETTQGSHTIANLSVTLTDSSERFQLRGFINNIGNTIILNNASFLATSGSFIGILSEPRHGGVSLSVKF